MYSDKLSDAFRKINNERELSGYLEEICNAIAKRSFNKDLLKSILLQRGLKTLDIKLELIHLMFEYIKIALEDDVLTMIEKEDIKLLRLWFDIRGGDFHNDPFIQQIVVYQLFRIYRDDLITSEEALLKADLQEIFDLSYDEMNEYSKAEALLAIKRGADVKDLDIVFTPEEYFKLKSQS